MNCRHCQHEADDHGERCNKRGCGCPGYEPIRQMQTDPASILHHWSNRLEGYCAVMKPESAKQSIRRETSA